MPKQLLKPVWRSERRLLLAGWMPPAVRWVPVWSDLGRFRNRADRLAA